MQDEQKISEHSHRVVQPGFGRESDIRSILSYWSSMRRNGDVPRRSDIDPRGIDTLLSNAFVAERIAAGLARFRIAGTHLSDLMGMEVRGMPVTSFIEPEHRDALAGMIVEMFDAPATIQLQLRSKGGIGRPEIKGVMIMLPLRSDLGDISRVLGCLLTKGPVGRGPRRFEITNKIVQHLDLPQTTPGPPASAPVLQAGMAEDASPFRAEAPLQGSERPYLRLVR